MAGQGKAVEYYLDGLVSWKNERNQLATLHWREGGKTDYRQKHNISQLL